MRRKLGNPDCPKCKGEGMTPGTPVTRSTVDGRQIKYSSVVRCACINPAPDPSSAAAERKPDAAERAAGETG